MIDIVMTAALRPEIIERTLKSIMENIDYRPLRLFVDIAAVGDLKYSQMEVLSCVKDVFDGTVKARMIPNSKQADALKWTWERSDSNFALQWEDDWVLNRKIDIQNVIKLMKEFPKFGMIYFDRQYKSILTHKPYKGVFDKVLPTFYRKNKGRSLGGPPALLRKVYMKDVISIVNGNVCLDLLSATPQAQKILTKWDVGTYIGEDLKGNLIVDIGKKWRAERGLIMKKNTPRGVTWQKIC